VSHHLDTPHAHESGQLYLDDLYVFGNDHATVLIMDVNSTITGPDVQPGFRAEARYECKVHVNGSESESVTYRLAFAESGPDGRQSYRLYRLIDAEAHDDAATGELVLEGHTGDATDGPGLRAWAGRVTDPFYIDLSLLSLVNAAVRDGTAPDLSSWRPEQATNSFADTTVESIVLEVSHEDPRLHIGTPIGVWARTMLATDAGGWRQINRAGNPMMWPIFWPDDTDFTNPANTRHPSADWTGDGKHLADQIAAVVAAAGTGGDPQGYGAVAARRLLPDVLPYVVGTPASFGFSGRNGRTLADNAPEAMLSMVVNSAVQSGLTPSICAHRRAARFPYVVPA
jgi:hypothetical protein